MKRLGWIIFIGLLVGMTSCLDDEGDYSVYDQWIGFGMVEQVGSDPVSYKIILDDGEQLIPVASAYPWYYYDKNGISARLLTGDRILVNFTIVDEEDSGNEEDEDAGIYYVRINSIKKILLKGVMDITEEIEDSIGNDPLIVRQCWVTDSLLNFEIKYWGYSEIHFINLVKLPGDTAAEGRPLELQLRHNENGDSRDFPYVAFVSFHMNSLKQAGMDSIQFRVTSTDYEGRPFEFHGVYHYPGSDE